VKKSDAKKADTKKSDAKKSDVKKADAKKSDDKKAADDKKTGDGKVPSAPKVPRLSTTTKPVNGSRPSSAAPGVSVSRTKAGAAPPQSARSAAPPKEAGAETNEEAAPKSARVCIYAIFFRIISLPLIMCCVVLWCCLVHLPFPAAFQLTSIFALLCFALCCFVVACYHLKPAKSGADKKADVKKSDVKKADSKKADVKKADAKKATSSKAKAEPKKADPKAADSVVAMAGAVLAAVKAVTDAKPADDKDKEACDGMGIGWDVCWCVWFGESEGELSAPLITCLYAVLCVCNR
jgi:hypothetical protein